MENNYSKSITNELKDCSLEFVIKSFGKKEYYEGTIDDLIKELKSKKNLVIYVKDETRINLAYSIQKLGAEVVIRWHLNILR